MILGSGDVDYQSIKQHICVSSAGVLLQEGTPSAGSITRGFLPSSSASRYAPRDTRPRDRDPLV